jgi:signal transduction histidine kinase
MTKIRLRTKFLLSVIVISSGLMTGTLLTVRYSVQKQVRTSLRENSILTYQSFEQQRDATFTKSAEMVADLPNLRALMKTHDIPTISDASGEIWRLSGADFIVLADANCNVMALRAESKDLAEAHAERLLKDSLLKERQRGWWHGDKNLYEVWIQPIYFGSPSSDNLLGFVVIGHEIDEKATRLMASIAATDVVFSYGGVPVVGTLESKQFAAFGKDFQPLLMAGHYADGTREIQLGSESYILTTITLSPIGDRPVVLSLLKSFDKASAFLGALNRLLVTLGVLAILTGSGLVLIISNTFTRRLESLVGGVRALESGDFNYPLAGRGRDEVGELTAAFEKMRITLKRNQDEQTSLEERLRQAHKMEAVGRLAGGVAHDFNNLLTIIRGHGDLLTMRGNHSKAETHSIEQIQRAADRAVAMTRQLLAFSRMQVLQPRVLDLNTIMADMGKMLPRLIGPHIRYRFVADTTPALIKADPGQIEQVIMNLAVNARDAMPDRGTLTVKILNVEIDGITASKQSPMIPGNYVMISVTDTGHGMDAETQAHIFEPFFTTKRLGKGTGLGLATVYGIVKQSSGFIWLESVPERGSEFKIYLPQATGPVMALTLETSPQPLALRHETVLIVEDETGVRELACEFLKMKGYTVLEAGDGFEALSIIGQKRATIDLVLSDIMMPRMGGIELVKRLAQVAPEMKVLLMSGYYEYSNLNSPSVPASTLLLQKPFSPASLVAKVREALTGVRPVDAETSEVVGNSDQERVEAR